MKLELIAETAGVPGYFENSTEVMSYYSCAWCKTLYQGRKTKYTMLSEEPIVTQSEIEQYKGPLTRGDIINSARYFNERITVQ